MRVPSRSWTNGSTRQWRRIRLLILTRDQYRCRLQLDGCTTRATEVHHTIGRQVSGDDPRYLVAACRNCNQQAGDPRRADPAPKPRTNWTQDTDSPELPDDFVPPSASLYPPKDFDG